MKEDVGSYMMEIIKFLKCSEFYLNTELREVRSPNLRIC